MTGQPREGPAPRGASGGRPAGPAPRGASEGHPPRPAPRGASEGRPPGPAQLGLTDVKRLNRDWRRRTEARIGLLLDDVGQPFNVGAIIRTAAAFGVAHVWLCGGTALPGHPSARKTALGTDRLLSFSRVPSAAEAAEAAAADGYRIAAIELAGGAIPLHEAPLAGDVCLAVGNEDHGCSAALLAAADVVTYIPLPGKVGSLNVAAAAAIGLAEVRRREWAAGTGR